MSAPAPRRRTPGRLLRAVVGALLGSIVLSACDFDVYQLPLPGGADAGDDPMTVTVMFVDVLDLVPKSTVKVNDVSVGEVTDVDLDGYTAMVTLEIRNDIDLPDNATASIRQTSLLGEKFVSLAAPEPPTGADTGAGPGPLGDGDVIPLERSGRNPEVEEVLGALSLLLNGGGVAQLQTIARELNLALAGREDSARSVLTQVKDLTATLDTNKEDIVAAIESLNALALSVDEQLPDIDAALAELPSALRSIDAQRADLVAMLQALDDLSDVGVSVVTQSKEATIRSLELLEPVLTQLADAGDSFVNAFSTFYAYPFVDEVVGRDPQVARNLHMGDYTNLSVELNVDLRKLPDLVGDLPTDLPEEILDAVEECLATADLTSPACTRLVGTQVLVDYCLRAENRNGPLCTTLRPPGLPQLPPPPQVRPPNVPTTPINPAPPNPPVPLPDPVLGLLNRAPTGPWLAPTPDGRGGPTMAQLTQTYDPALVSLLVPGMVTR